MYIYISCTRPEPEGLITSARRGLVAVLICVVPSSGRQRWNATCFITSGFIRFSKWKRRTIISLDVKPGKSAERSHDDGPETSRWLNEAKIIIILPPTIHISDAFRNSYRLGAARIRAAHCSLPSRGQNDTGSPPQAAAVRRALESCCDQESLDRRL